MIRITLPQYLRTLARVDGDIEVAVSDPVTLGGALDVIERAYPVLCGTIRDQVNGRRRPLVRFCACGEDLSNEPSDVPLPEPVLRGDEPLLVVGAMAGG